MHRRIGAVFCRPVLAWALPEERAGSLFEDSDAMCIDIVGDGSISHQARTYAEYRLFAALSQVFDTREVRKASLVLRRARRRGSCDPVSCSVTVELNDDEVVRLRTSGEHPYAAINRAVERLRLSPAAIRSGRHHAQREAVK